MAPSAGIYIYSATGNFALLFWIALALALTGFVCASTVRIPRREKVVDKPKMSLDHFFLSRAWMMAVNISLFGLCWGVMSNYVAIYGQESLGITDGTGVFFMLLSAGLFLSRLYGAKSLRAGLLTRNCVRGVICSTVGYVLFATSLGEWSFYLSALLVGLGNGQMYPAFLNMFIKVARHDQRGTANSSILISWDIGMGVGILVGGFIAEYIGYGAAFWVTAVAQATGALLFILMTRHFFERRRLE